MKKNIIIILFITLFTPCFALASTSMAKKLSGYILLQVESLGEAWYVNPTNYKKYYLARPSDAFKIMRELGVGITNQNLEKIPIGILNNIKDNDNDGLDNDTEIGIGTNPNNPDTDNDGFLDGQEVRNNHDPAGTKKIIIDLSFTKQYLGKIFLQVQDDGQAWYINPADEKRYYLGRPGVAFAIMRQLGLGITNENLAKIETDSHYFSIEQNNNDKNNYTENENNNSANILHKIADAIKIGDKTKATSFFTADMKKAIEYTIDFLNSDSRLVLANILYGSKLKSSDKNQKNYYNEVYFGLQDKKVPVNFRVKKQSNEEWLLTNL